MSKHFLLVHFVSYRQVSICPSLNYSGNYRTMTPDGGYQFSAEFLKFFQIKFVPALDIFIESPYSTNTILQLIMKSSAYKPSVSLTIGNLL